MKLDRRRLGPLVLIGAGVVMMLFLGPKMPRDQLVHVVLGDAAARVSEVRIRYADPDASDADFAREATFRYAQGAAPRVLTHEPRLANGEYALEIEISKGNDRAMVKRQVKLDGSPVSVDVRESVP